MGSGQGLTQTVLCPSKIKRGRTEITKNPFGSPNSFSLGGFGVLLRVVRDRRAEGMTVIPQEASPSDTDTIERHH